MSHLEPFDQLLEACKLGNVEVVRGLLEQTPELVYLQSEDEEQLAALHVAAGAGHMNVVEELLAHGAPWNAVDFKHRSAGCHARDGGHENIYERLADVRLARRRGHLV